MAVKEARRKVVVLTDDAGERIGAGLGIAREKLSEGLGEGKKIAGRQLKAAGASAAAGLAVAREKARPKVERARKRSGRALEGTRRKVGYWIAGEKPPSRTRRIGTGILAGAAGAAMAFFLDPVSGKRRRHVAGQWMAARARGMADGGRRLGGAVAARATGAAREIRNRRDATVPESDQVLSHKVQSELYQATDVPTGININAENGIVVLRGQVERPDQIQRIEGAVRRIQGVQGVENLLHLPGTPAPTHT